MDKCEYIRPTPVQTGSGVVECYLYEQRIKLCLSSGLKCSKAVQFKENRELIKALNAEIVGIIGACEASINVMIDEIEKENWAAGGELYAGKFPD